MYEVRLEPGVMTEYTQELLMEEQKLIEYLEDLFEQADEDTPLEYRSQGFTDALRNAEELLIKYGRRVKE